MGMCATQGTKRLIYFSSRGDALALRYPSPPSGWDGTFTRSCRTCSAYNRHRGSGRPLAPATPPYMRVRIRRFGGVELPRAQVGKTEGVEVSVGKRRAQGRAIRQPPRTTSLPLLPDHGSQSSPYPLIQSMQYRGRLAVAEVSLPATQVAGQFLRHLGQTDASCPSRQFPHSSLAAKQSLRRDAPFRLFSAGEAEAQKLSRLRPRHRALRLVHLELEPPPEEARHTLHDALPRPLAGHVDIAIIRVTHEAVLTPLQLPVQFVEHEIR